ncbi:hypothetical protein ACP4OV_015949 [Aristida adscensionis]
MEMQSIVMASFSLKPQLQGSSRRSCRPAAVTSRPSISWKWQQQQRRVTMRHVLHEADSRLMKNENTGIFHPSIWGDFFLGYCNPASSQQQQAWMEHTDQLKNEVAEVIASTATRSLNERLNLINSLERLCVDHLFEEEINAALTQIETANVSDCDLGTVSLWFYLLRKHRYRVPADVFVRFKDEEGGFSASNPMDILNLYNAAHLRTHGEIILDEAALFTRRCLEKILPSVEGPVAHEIKSALEIPLPRRGRIYELKFYISTYEKDATVHDKLLQLAKLNSNIMQLQYQHELEVVTRWWKDVQVESRFPFARDRIVECYLWSLGAYFEPCYSRGRIILAMMFAIATLLDDTYDSYGTLQECDIFTKFIESWDCKEEVHDLPDCMEFALGYIFDSFQTIENMLREDEKYRMSYLQSCTIDLARCYNKEVKMREKSYIPSSVEEHLHVSLRTGACYMLSCASFVGMDGTATKECFDWVTSLPKLVQALCIILRLVDDLQTYEREKSMPQHVASTIDSYMKEHNVSTEVAREMIYQLHEDSWKDFNDEWLNPDNNAMPKQLLERIFDLTRTMEFMYNQDDNFTNCQNLKDTISSLLVEPFTIII